MLKLSQDAKLVTAFGKQLSYTLPLDSTDVSNIFNTMEEQKRWVKAIQASVVVQPSPSM